MLRFGLLGPLEVRRGDGSTAPVVPLGPRKQRAVLGVLLLEAGRVVSTDRLVDSVWGEEPPGSVLASLHAYVSNLRRLLRDDDRATSPLSRRAPGYVCDVAEDQLDVARFDAQRTVAEAASDEHDWSTAATSAADALAIWRGPLLADLADEEWVRVAAAHLEERRTATRRTLVTALLGVGRTSDAVGESGRLLADLPLDERVCWLHLVALHRAGRTAEALEAWRTYADRLDDELGLSPGPALRDLQGALLRQDPALAAWPHDQPGDVPGVIEPAGAAPEPTARTDTDDLVGREHELSVAAEVLDAASGWVVLAGAPGIGKTHLAEVCLRRWVRAGRRVSRTSCPDAEGLPAWWPLRSVLRDLDADPDELLLPPRGVDIDAARFVTFERVAGVLSRAAAEAPLLVLVDDVHWADRTSLAFLTLLAESGSVPGLVVLLTTRAEAGGAPVSRLLAAVARNTGARHLSLPPLTEADVVELAARVSGGEVGAGEAARLARRTGGNPFLVSEYARLPADVRRAGGIPGAVRSVLERRLAGLDPDVLGVLQVAAVIGQRLDVDLLRQVTDLGRVELADVLDAAVDERVITVGSVGSYEFVHALMREQLDHQLTGPERRRLHLRLAEHLGARVGPDRMAARAGHLVAALPLSEATECVEACRSAALDAEERWQSEEAAWWWGQAIAAADLLPSDTEVERDDLVVAQVAAYARAGRGQTVLDTVDAALEAAVRDGRLSATGRLAVTLLRSTGAWNWATYGAEQDVRLQTRLRTLDSLLGSDPRARVQVLTTLAVGSCYDPDPSLPDRLSAEALRLAESLDDDEVLADALLGRALSFSGIAERAVESLALLDRLAVVPHGYSRVDEVLRHNLASLATLMLGRIDDAAEHLRLGIAGSELLRLPVSRAQFRWVQSQLTQWYGDDLAQVERQVDQAWEIHRQTELYQGGVLELAHLALRWDDHRLADLELAPAPAASQLRWMGTVVRVARREPGFLGTFRAEVLREEPVIWTTHARWTLLAHLVADLADEHVLGDLAVVLRERLGGLGGGVANFGQIGTIGPVDLALARLCLVLDDEAAARRHLVSATSLAEGGRAARHLLRCRLLAAQLDPPDDAALAGLVAEADRLRMPWVRAAATLLASPARRPTAPH